MLLSEVNKFCGEGALRALSERINVVIFMNFIFRDGKIKLLLRQKPSPVVLSNKIYS